jgi:hypothetical protein
MDELEDVNERDVSVRANGSQVFTEPYSEGGIDRLKNMVLTFYQQGDRKFYSISVDGEVVVQKTSDGRKFDRYLQFLDKNTNTVEVRMYQGASPNCNKYQFIVSKGLTGPSSVAKGDIDTQIQRALENQRRQFDFEKLQKDLAKEKKKRRKLQKINESADTGLAQITKILENGTQLFGALGFGKKQPGFSGVIQPQAEVEIEMESPSTATTEEPQKKETVFALKVLEHLRKTFGEEAVNNALGWLSAIVNHPQIQETIKAELDKLNKENNGQA